MTGAATKGLPLFFRLLIAFLAVTIVVSSALVFVAYVFSKKSIEERTQEDIARQVAAIGDYFKVEYQSNLRRNLRELASAPLVDDYLSSSTIEKPIIARKVERLFVRMIMDFEGYQSIYFIDALGAEKIGAIGGKRVRDLKNLRRAEGDSNGSHLEAAIRLFDRLETQTPPQIYIEGPFADGTGNPAFLAGISRLDYDTGELGGIMVIQCSLAPLLTYLSRVEFFGEDLIRVLAPDGWVLKEALNKSAAFDIASYPLHKPLEELELVVLEPGILALRDLSIAPDAPLLRIAIGIPTSLLLKDIEPTFRFFSLVLAISLVAVLGVALYLSRYLATPIVELASATTRLAQGDLSIRVQAKVPGEMRMLVDSFNGMAEELQKQAEALRESEARFRTLAEHGVDALFVAGSDGKFIDVNQQTCECLGYTREEMLELRVPDVQEELTHEQFVQLWDRMVPGVPVTRGGYHRRKDGTTFPVEVRIGLFERDGSPLLLAQARDVTERKQAEEAQEAAEAELEKQRTLSMRADRLRSLGEMAAGISHELNQPLMGVRGLAEHALIGMQRGWKVTENNLVDKLERIVEQTDRMVHIIEHVRLFAREAGKPEVLPVQVNEVVASSVDMLEAQFRSRGIEMTSELAEDLPPVLANSYSLEEVMLNLLNNARDAVEDQIQVKGEDAPTRVKLRTEQNAQHIRIEVEDSGLGIPQEVIGKVFDPFFTTKGPDKGTGLGLAVSRTIIEGFGGTLQIRSARGEGTRVTILLPTASALSKLVL